MVRFSRHMAASDLLKINSSTRKILAQPSWDNKGGAGNIFHSERKNRRPTAAILSFVIESTSFYCHPERSDCAPQNNRRENLSRLALQADILADEEQRFVLALQSGGDHGLIAGPHILQRQVGGNYRVFVFH